MVRMLLNDYIKKLILILLTVVTVYVFFLMLPFIGVIFTFIFRILFPFLIAFAIAFILQPLVNYFQERGLKRWLSVFIVLLIFGIVISLVVSLTVPKLFMEVKEIIKEFPVIAGDIKEIVNNFAAKFDFLPDGYQPNFDNLNNFVSKYLVHFEQFPENIINKLGSILGFIILVPMMLIYFLLDYEKILCMTRNFLFNN